MAPWSYSKEQPYLTCLSDSDSAPIAMAMGFPLMAAGWYSTPIRSQKPQTVHQCLLTDLVYSVSTAVAVDFRPRCLWRRTKWAVAAAAAAIAVVAVVVEELATHLTGGGLSASKRKRWKEAWLEFCARGHQR